MKICSERLHLQLGYMLFLTHYFIEKGETQENIWFYFQKCLSNAMIEVLNLCDLCFRMQNDVKLPPDQRRK